MTLSSTTLYHAMAVKALMVIAIGKVVLSPPVMPLLLLSAMLDIGFLCRSYICFQVSEKCIEHQWKVPCHISLDVQCGVEILSQPGPAYWNPIEEKGMQHLLLYAPCVCFDLPLDETKERRSLGPRTGAKCISWRIGLPKHI